MEKYVYTIGEVAEMLGEPVSLVRYWTKVFSRFLKLERSGHGNRLFKSEDVDTLKDLHRLVKDEGMTLEGAALRYGESRKKVSSKVKALESLEKIRAQLVEVRKGM